MSLRELCNITSSTLRVVDGAFPILSTLHSPSTDVDAGRAFAIVKVAVTLRQEQITNLRSAILSEDVAGTVVSSPSRSTYTRDGVTATDSPDAPLSPLRQAMTVGTDDGAGSYMLDAGLSPLRLRQEQQQQQEPGRSGGGGRATATDSEEDQASSTTTDQASARVEAKSQARRAKPNFVPRLSTEPHRFACSVDTRTIRHLQAGSTAAKIFVRYIYPFFGSPVPVISHPPITVARHSEKLLPASFTAFEFTSSRADVFSQFRDAPIRVELLQTDTVGLSFPNLQTPNLKVCFPFQLLLCAILKPLQPHSMQRTEALVLRHYRWISCFSQSLSKPAMVHW